MQVIDPRIYLLFQSIRENSIKEGKVVKSGGLMEIDVDGFIMRAKKSLVFKTRDKAVEELKKMLRDFSDSL